MKPENNIKNFFQTEIDRGVSRNYATMQRTCCQEFCDFLERNGYTNFNEVNRAIIKVYEGHLERRPKQRGEGTLSTVMIRHNLNSIKYFFRYLEATSIITENPLDSYEMPVPKVDKRIILSVHEISNLLKSCENLTEQTIIRLAYGCGLRRKEIVSMDSIDIDFKGCVLHVNKGKGNKKKQYKYRKIHLPKSLAEQLSRYYLEERPNYIKSKTKDNQNAFLLSGMGTRMSSTTVMKRFKEVLSRTELYQEVGLHTLRHSIACHLIDSGMKMELVQKFLGHSHLDTTLIYTQYLKKKSY